MLLKQKRLPIKPSPILVFIWFLLLLVWARHTGIVSVVVHCLVSLGILDSQKWREPHCAQSPIKLEICTRRCARIGNRQRGMHLVMLCYALMGEWSPMIGWCNRCPISCKHLLTGQKSSRPQPLVLPG